MSDHEKTSPKTPTSLQIRSDRSPPPAPYRPTVDRLPSDDTQNSSKKPAADTNALPSGFAHQNQPGNRIDPMRRQYPAPKEPLDIEKALELTPRPHTFRHHLREIKKAGSNKYAREMTEEDQKAEFERVKRSLKSWGTDPRF